MTTVWRLLIDNPDDTLAWMASSGRIAIGWGEIGDIRQLGTPDAIAAAIRERNESHPDHAGKPAANVQHGTNSLHDFCYQMRAGDLVIVSDGSHRRSVWQVVGAYEYAEPAASPLNYQHQRAARAVELDPEELWQQAGGRLADGQVNYRTLGRCANGVE
jgi:predicted Mrr-cat superfamily restriction endonuclease